MPESHPLRRIASAPELRSMSSSGTERQNAVDWVRQTRDDKQKFESESESQENQEIVESSSTLLPTRNILRNLVLECRNSDQLDGQAIASSSITRQDGFGAARCFERDNTHDRAIRRDSTSSEERPLTTRDLWRIEEGMGSTVRAELDRRDNRPHTWREWANSDWNTIVSTGGMGLGLLGVAAFVYTYRPDLIPHH